jgi:diadenosine tetraphosphatase ApaH/serine/threonine PP2A family protein phosphatase
VIAIISDIHSNLAALEAVLADIQARNIKQVLCLGDIVGYGPNPRECVDLCRPHELTLMGNHDEAIFQSRKTEEFNLRAEMALEWTRDELARSNPPEGATARLDVLRNLKLTEERTINETPLLLVHGSPRRPLREYIFPRDIRNPEKMRDIFSRFPRLCFVGHSHVPGIYPEDLTYTHPSELELLRIYHFDENQKTVINVGSVGQPRDNDPRACYVTLTDEADAVVFRRVKYDIERTRQLIHGIPGLDNSLGDRLLEGR